MNNDDFRITLYAARINKGLSRAEVAKRVGISVNLLGRYETGRAEPKASTVQALCEVYEIGIERLRFD